MYLSKPTECTTRLSPHVNHGLWMVMMCQCRFTDCNKCTTVVGDFDSGGDSAYIEVIGREACASCSVLLEPKAAKNKQTNKKTD